MFYLVFIFFTLLEVLHWIGIIPHMTGTEQIFLGFIWIISLCLAFLELSTAPPEEVMEALKKAQREKEKKPSVLD